MRAYSIDLRECVLASVESGECNIPAAARRFKVSEPTIERWLARYRKSGNEARRAQKESVELSKSVGDRWGLGYAYRGLGMIAQRQHDHQQAVDMFHKSLNTLTELGARQDMARVLVETARSVLALGNDADAEHIFRESLRLAIETKGLFIATEALVGIARLRAKQDDTEHAIELLLVVLNHPASIQDTRDRADHLRVELEAQLTPLQIESIKVHAEEKTLESVVEGLLR